MVDRCLLSKTAADGAAFLREESQTQQIRGENGDFPFFYCSIFSPYQLKAESRSGCLQSCLKVRKHLSPQTAVFWIM